MLALCIHPNIIAILERDVEQLGRKYMILELMKCNLEEYFERKKSIFTGPYKAPQGMVSKWALDIAEALRFLHGMTPKIVHRDLKPGNVLLDHNLTCKIGDLGLCKAIDRDFLKSRADNPVDINTGLVGGYMMTGHVGTYGYMAPEVGPDSRDSDGL